MGGSTFIASQLDRSQSENTLSTSLSYLHFSSSCCILCYKKKWSSVVISRLKLHWSCSWLVHFIHRSVCFAAISRHYIFFFKKCFLQIKNIVLSINCDLEPKNNDGRLRKRLFCNYDKSVHPSKFGLPVNVNLKMVLKGFSFVSWFLWTLFRAIFIFFRVEIVITMENTKQFKFYKEHKRNSVPWLFTNDGSRGRSLYGEMWRSQSTNFAYSVH